MRAFDIDTGKIVDVEAKKLEKLDRVIKLLEILIDMKSGYVIKNNDWEKQYDIKEKERW
jgi:hypothetical protein